MREHSRHGKVAVLPPQIIQNVLDPAAVGLVPAPGSAVLFRCRDSLIPVATTGPKRSTASANANRGTQPA